MSRNDIRVRPALAADSPALAKIHIETWRNDYRGFASDGYLASLSVEEVAGAYRGYIQAEETCVLLAEDAAGHGVGLASCGPYRDEGYRLNDTFLGEIYNLYVLPRGRNTGTGRALVAAAARWLQAHGMGSMMLWTLERSTSKSFYARIGGRIVGRREATIGANEVTDLAFGWDDVKVLFS